MSFRIFSSLFRHIFQRSAENICSHFHDIFTQEKIFEDACKKVSHDGRALIEKRLIESEIAWIVLKRVLKEGSFPLIIGA